VHPLDCGDGRAATNFAQQSTSSVLHRRQGLEPSHLVFLIRHLSHALRTRLRTFDLDSGLDGIGDWEERRLTLSFVRVRDTPVGGNGSELCSGMVRARQDCYSPTGACHMLFC